MSRLFLRSSSRVSDENNLESFLHSYPMPTRTTRVRAASAASSFGREPSRGSVGMGIGEGVGAGARPDPPIFCAAACRWYKKNAECAHTKVWMWSIMKGRIWRSATERATILSRSCAALSSDPYLIGALLTSAQLPSFLVETKPGASLFS